jgi:hypothetical protein
LKLEIIDEVSGVCRDRPIKAFEHVLTNGHSAGNFGFLADDRNCSCTVSPGLGALEDTMTTEQKIIRAKVGLLELAKQLGNVSQACKMMGYSRDSSHRHLAHRFPANPENCYHPRQFRVHSGNPD